jgi:hypothetical protein
MLLVGAIRGCAMPELERPRPSRDDEDLLLGVVTVRRVVQLARRDLEQPEAGRERSSRAAEIAHAPLDRRADTRGRLDLVDVHHVSRALAQVAELRRPECRLPLPRMVGRVALEHPRRA